MPRLSAGISWGKKRILACAMARLYKKTIWSAMAYWRGGWSARTFSPESGCPSCIAQPLCYNLQNEPLPLVPTRCWRPPLQKSSFYGCEQTHNSADLGYGGLYTTVFLVCISAHKICLPGIPTGSLFPIFLSFFPSLPLYERYKRQVACVQGVGEPAGDNQR